MNEDSRLRDISTTLDIERTAEDIYGEVPTSSGLLHVTSAWRKDPATHLTLRIGKDTPRALHDTFALGLARARADAIVTTGRILRQEPELSHALPGPHPMATALADWRRTRLAKARPALSLIMTASGEIDLSHPIFDGPGRVVIYTGRRGQWQLDSRAPDAGAEIIGCDDPSPRGAIELLRSQFGAATIAIEAGPTVARDFYEPPAALDELLLSLFLGPTVPSSVRGIRQPPPQHLEHAFARRSAGFEVNSADGPWSFLRFQR